MSDPVLDLLTSPPVPPMSVDERSVYAGGRRRLRRRTLRRTGVGVVGLVGAAAIAFSTLGSGLGGEALPAAPSPTTASPSRVVADVLGGRYAVEVVMNPASGQPNVVFHRYQDGTRVQLAGSDASPDVVSLGTGSGAEGVMLGTAPADATAFLTVTRADSGLGAQHWDQQPLPGTEYQAVALQFDDPKNVDAYVDTIWTNSLGEVHSARGELLPSVPTNDGDQFFLAREAGTMGVFLADGSGGSTRPLTSGDSTTMGYGTKVDGADWAWNSVTVLPEGARAVGFEWAHAARTTQVTVRSLGTAEVAFASASAPGSGPSPTVTKVSWTDKAGTRHTETVE